MITVTGIYIFHKYIFYIIYWISININKKLEFYCIMSKIQHNLDIQTYNLEELLNLFDLTFDFDVEQLKRAKKKVLFLHPDKSHLSPEYFLFYKKAFDIVYAFFQEKTKQQRTVPKEKVEYDANDDTGVRDEINGVMKNMKAREFQSKFNQLFEENMATKVDASKFEWFKNETPMYDQKVNGSVNDAIQQVKSQGLVQYNGVQNITGYNNNQLYENDNNSYASSDIFGKLKYDDLRRVHKDETVFSVSEKDMNNIKTYSSVEQLNRDRGQQNLTPMEKNAAERMIDERQRQQDEYIMKKQYESTQKSMVYEQKNKDVLSNFLRLRF